MHKEQKDLICFVLMSLCCGIRSGTFRDACVGPLAVQIGELLANVFIVNMSTQ